MKRLNVTTNSMDGTVTIETWPADQREAIRAGRADRLIAAVELGKFAEQLAAHLRAVGHEVAVAHLT